MTATPTCRGPLARARGRTPDERSGGKNTAVDERVHSLHVRALRELQLADTETRTAHLQLSVKIEGTRVLERERGHRPPRNGTDGNLLAPQPLRVDHHQSLILPERQSPTRDLALTWFVFPRRVAATEEREARRATACAASGRLSPPPVQGACRPSPPPGRRRCEKRPPDHRVICPDLDVPRRRPAAGGVRPRLTAARG